MSARRSPETEYDFEAMLMLGAVIWILALATLAVAWLAWTRSWWLFLVLPPLIAILVGVSRCWREAWVGWRRDHLSGVIILILVATSTPALAWTYHGGARGYHSYASSYPPGTYGQGQINNSSFGYVLPPLSGGIQSWGMEGGLPGGSVLCVPPTNPKDQAIFLARLPKDSIVPTPENLPTTYVCVRFHE